MSPTESAFVDSDKENLAWSPSSPTSQDLLIGMGAQFDVSPTGVSQSKEMLVQHQRSPDLRPSDMFTLQAKRSVTWPPINSPAGGTKNVTGTHFEEIEKRLATSDLPPESQDTAVIAAQSRPHGGGRGSSACRTKLQDGTGYSATV